MKIAKMVVDMGSMTIEELAESAGVSAMTVYRDVATLEEMGMVTLTRGQVHALASTLSEAGAVFRMDQHVDAKRAIAREAGKLIPPGSSLLLDDSTSGLFLLDELIGKGPFFIVTNSLMVAQKVADVPDITLQVTGGEYQRWARAMTGSTTLRAISEVRTDFCFLSASGISTTGCYHPYVPVADIKRAMIDSAEVAVLLTDSTKFRRRSLHRFAELRDFDVIVTEVGIDEERLEMLKALPGAMIVADLP